MSAGLPRGHCCGTMVASIRRMGDNVEAGLLCIFQNYQGTQDDAEVYRRVLAVADLAEPLGYDKLWAAEHHFTDYSMCPDNVDFLCYMAGRTSRIKLGTGAIIVPWSDPLRAASKMIMLDHMSGGRAVLGLGRGLAKVEYDTFGIEMGSSRGRFDEGAPMILRALETGYIESEGPDYPQRRTELRPRPLSTKWRDRLYCVGMSPESVQEAAKLGARLMSFAQKPWDLFKQESLDPYLETFRRVHGREPGPVVCGDLMVCHEDSERARELAFEYIVNYFHTIVKHYALMGEHFAKVGGYDNYASSAELFKAVGLEAMAAAYVEFNTWGTPEEIIEKLRERRRLLDHPMEMNMIVEMGGIAQEDMERSVRLFAERVLPVIREWD